MAGMFFLLESIGWRVVRPDMHIMIIVQLLLVDEFERRSFWAADSGLSNF